RGEGGGVDYRAQRVALPDELALGRVERVDEVVVAAEVHAAARDRGRGQHRVAGRELPDPRALLRVNGQELAVVGPEMEPPAGHDHVGAEAVIARLRVVEGQSLDRLRDDTDLPALLARGRGELVELAVVGLEVHVAARDRGPRADGTAGRERPALAP